MSNQFQTEGIDGSQKDLEEFLSDPQMNKEYNKWNIYGDCFDHQIVWFIVQQSINNPLIEPLKYHVFPSENLRLRILKQISQYNTVLTTYYLHSYTMNRTGGWLLRGRDDHEAYCEPSNIEISQNPNI